MVQNFDPAILLNTPESLERYFKSQAAAMPRVLEGYDSYLDQFVLTVETECRQVHWIVEEIEFLEGQFVVTYTFKSEDTDAVIEFLKRIEKKTGHSQMNIIHEQYTEFQGRLAIQYYPF